MICYILSVCLNPYFTGISFAIENDSMIRMNILLSLNPYFTGISFAIMHKNLLGKGTDKSQSLFYRNLFCNGNIWINMW